MQNHTVTDHMCVKCGDQHNSVSCKKPRMIPATCALCAGPHPANYKGCWVYQEVQNKTSPQTQSSHKSRKKLRNTCDETFQIYVRGVLAADYIIWIAMKGFKRSQVQTPPIC